MSSRPTFNCLAPIRLSADNFAGANDLNALAILGTLQPSHIATFVQSNKGLAYQQVHSDENPFYFKQQDESGEQAIFKADMWETTYSSAKTGQERKDRLLLVNEVIISPEKTIMALEPRLVITNGQSVWAYRMSCCGDSFSAIQFTRQGGIISPSLLEATRFIKTGVRDLFGVKNPKSIVREDPDGRLLSHWRGHVSGGIKISGCTGHINLTIPPRIRAFCNH